jgi:hypothetical protein
VSRGFDRHRSPAQRRAPQPRLIDWEAALEHGARLARAAQTPGVVGDAGDLVQFRLRVRDLTAESYPPPAEPARLLAGAFLNAARAFAHPQASPETRTACAALLAEAARTVGGLLDLHRTQLARGTWGRQFGDD